MPDYDGMRERDCFSQPWKSKTGSSKTWLLLASTWVLSYVVERKKQKDAKEALRKRVDAGEMKSDEAEELLKGAFDD